MTRDELISFLLKQVPLFESFTPVGIESIVDGSELRTFEGNDAGFRVVLNRKGELVADPDIVMDGIPETAANGAEMLELALDAADGAIRSIPPSRRKDAEVVEEAISKSVRAAIDQAWGKKPIVHCIVTKVDARA
mgnify:CR=1 FL=1